MIVHCRSFRVFLDGRVGEEETIMVRRVEQNISASGRVLSSIYSPNKIAGFEGSKALEVSLLLSEGS